MVTSFMLIKAGVLATTLSFFCTAVRVMAASLIRGDSSIQTSTTLFCLISEVQGARYRQVRFTPIRWII